MAPSASHTPALGHMPACLLEPDGYECDIPTDMFTEEYRRRLRDHLIRRAELDPRLVGVALTGSASVDREDRWSDIDLAVAVGDDRELHEVIREWSDHMRSEFGVVDVLDVTSRETVYRVFLLPNTLQVDIAFAPAAEFGALAATFRLLSGIATEQPRPTPPDMKNVIGMAWLYGLHARSSIARGKPWQAEYMISAVRNHVVMLACIRHALPVAHARGADALPLDLRTALTGTLVMGTDQPDLIEAFDRVMQLLAIEVEFVSPELTAALAPVFAELVRTADPGVG